MRRPAGDAGRIKKLGGAQGALKKLQTEHDALKERCRRAGTRAQV